MIGYWKKLSTNSKIIVIVGIILSFIVRLCFFNYESHDYNNFLKNWIEFIKENGGVFALKYTFSDYNIPYLLFLSIISYISVKPLYLIKIFSVIFDYLIALLGCKFITSFKSNFKERDIVLVFLFLIFSPTILFNSSFWGQCDSIYTFFALLSIYYLCKEDIIKSFIFFGISISFKLQAIFILPVFIIMFFCTKKVKLWHFLLIPITNTIICLPGTLFGASLFYTYKIYFFQVGEYPESMNVLNIYNYFKGTEYINILGFVLTFLLFSLLLLFVYLKREKINTFSILLISLLSITMCYFFLPCMHERYLFMADVLSIILLFVLNLKIYIPLSINITSLVTYYIIYKLSYHVETYMYGPIFMFLCIILLIRKLVLLINNKDCECT